MRKAIIGLTTYNQKNIYGYPIAALMHKYIEAITEAGGVPLLLPTGIDNEAVEEISRRLDGFLFTGGGDLAPSSYREESHPNLDGVDEERDAMEFSLVRLVVGEKIPFLGICRGLQTINVTLGGSLYSHITDQLPSAIKHKYDSGTERQVLAHQVKITPSTRLAEILQEEQLSVNSLHHQAVKTLGDNLRCSGAAPDGLIEALELPNHPFGLAVQWHPEWLTDQLVNRRLFRAFVAAAEKSSYTRRMV